MAPRYLGLGPSARACFLALLVFIHKQLLLAILPTSLSLAACARSCSWSCRRRRRRQPAPGLLRQGVPHPHRRQLVRQRQKGVHVTAAQHVALGLCHVWRAARVCVLVVCVCVNEKPNRENPVCMC